MSKEISRFNLRVDKDLMVHVEYWAAKYGVTVSDYIRDAIAFRIAYENKDYDLPTAEQYRLQQILEVVEVLSRNVQALEDITINGFDSLLGLTRGDNYLLDREDGEV